MNKVCLSFCQEVILELALWGFFGTQHGVRAPLFIVHDTVGFFKSSIFAPKMGKTGRA